MEEQRRHEREVKKEQKGKGKNCKGEMREEGDSTQLQI